MKYFIKRFADFMDGLKGLADVSFSAKQSLSHFYGRFPKSEEEAISALALNAAFDRPTANGYGWGKVQIEVDAYGVRYTTTGGLIFGWYADLGASPFDTHEGDHVFFVAHPKADDESAAPADSTLRRSAEAHGWKEVSEMLLSIESYGKFM